MARIASVAFGATLATAPALAVFSNTQAFLSTNMQPDVVAKTLTHVEDEWMAEARTYVECELSESSEAAVKDCDNTPRAFSNSCATVVSAIAQGSDGNPQVMKEYMGDVCQQATMGASGHRDVCLTLADAIGMKMTASVYDNRVNFEANPICDDFWTQFLAEQKTLHEKEYVAIKEKEKHDQEEAAKFAATKQERSEKAAKDLEEALKREDAKEQAELAAERKLVAVRANRTKDKYDRDLQEREAEVDAVEEKAKEVIDDATNVEVGRSSTITAFKDDVAPIWPQAKVAASQNTHTAANLLTKLKSFAIRVLPVAGWGSTQNPRPTVTIARAISSDAAKGAQQPPIAAVTVKPAPVAAVAVKLKPVAAIDQAKPVAAIAQPKVIIVPPCEKAPCEQSSLPPKPSKEGNNAQDSASGNKKGAPALEPPGAKPIIVEPKAASLHVKLSIEQPKPSATIVAKNSADKSVPTALKSAVVAQATQPATTAAVTKKA